VEWPFVILLAQGLHAATYGAHHMAAMVLVHAFFTGRHQAKGQALYTGLTFGLGGTLGGVLSGYGWQWLGPSLTFTISAIAALVGLGLIAWKMGLRRPL
jgi:PPP family 3-phenylpropionic acid transporter